MRQSTALNNALWLIGGKAGRMLVSLAVGLLTARYLGPGDYGLIHYAAAYTGFFTALCTLGLDSVLVKELTDSPEKEGEILGTAAFLRGISSTLSVFAIACIVFLADRGGKRVMTVVGLSSLGLIFQSLEVFSYWFQFRRWSRVTAVVSLSAYTVAALYRAALLLLEKSVVWFAFAASAEQLLAACLLLAAYKRHQGGRLAISRERARSLLQKSCHFILPGLMVAVYAQTDKLMLKALLGEAATGYYATAVSVCNVWCFVLTAIIDAMYPEIAMAQKMDEKRFLRRNRQLYALIFYVSAAVSLALTFGAEGIVVALYGEAFRPAAAALRVLTWYTGFSYLGVARNAWVVCKGRQKYLLRVYAAGAAFNVLLNAWLIPKWGVSGAAAASLAAQMVTTMAAPFFIRQLRENGILMVQALALKGIFEERQGKQP